MKKRNYLIILLFISCLLFCLSGCGKHELQKFEKVDPTFETEGKSEYYYCKECDKYYSDSEEKNEIQKDSWILDKLSKSCYKIRVYDIDDECLGEAIVPTEDYNDLYTALKNKFAVEGDIGEYGAYITSINNSIVDNNWSMMFYVNGEQSWNSCDKVKPNSGDEVEFINECWACIDYGYGASMDEVDVIIDKCLYHYLKTTFKQTLENITDYNGSTYWEMLMLDMMKNSTIDSKLSNINFKEELVNTVKNTNINELSGANIGKYYIHAKALNNINSGFNAYYQTVIDQLDSFNPYVTPFLLIPNAFLDLTSTNFNTVINQEIVSDIAWGPITDLWSFICKSNFRDVSEIDLNNYIKDWSKEYNGGSSIDIATVLMAACANGDNLRDITTYNTINYNGKDLDYVSYLIYRYYDTTLNIVKVYDEDNALNMSSNQLYASLLVYKLLKSSSTKINIFGYIK